jgi:hypothetical protein
MSVNTLKSWTGPEGIEQYLSADVKGRTHPITQVVPKQSQPSEHGCFRSTVRT